MCAIDSTTGTIPGSLVMSMRWICAPRNFFLAARAVVFAFMGFLLAIAIHSPLDCGRVHRAKRHNEKSHRGLLRCFFTAFAEETRHCGPGWLFRGMEFSSIIR